MGIMGKLAFWKKDDEDTDSGSSGEYDLQSNMMDEQHPDLTNPFDSQPSQENFNPDKPFNVQAIRNTGVPPTATVNNDLLSKNIEIISIKIDTLKSELENMNQRLINIEAMARREQHPETNKRYPQW